MASMDQRTATWTEVQGGFSPFDGFSHWERATANRDLRAVMLFAELQAGGEITTLREAISAITSDSRARLQTAELDALATEVAELDRLEPGAGSSKDGDLSPPSAAFPWRVTVAFFWLGEIADLPAYCRLLHVGPRVSDLSEIDPRVSGALDLSDRANTAGGPVIACIDDGIAYLNQRFRASETTTRIEKIWLQAEPAPNPHRVVEPLPDVRIGQEVSKADIDRELASGLSEEHLYRLRNDAILPRDVRRSTNHHISHGTHVLDLAAGEDFLSDAEDSLAGLPILAVQLPPAAIAETSGRKTEGYVAIGLRWIVTEALRLSRGDGRPVILNLSLGSLAGPGDRTAFLAQWIGFEIDRYARLSGGGRLQVVAAYGNARLDQLVARSTVSRQKPVSIDWRVQPDDRTASFLELRTPQDGVSRLVNLRAPDGRVPSLSFDWPAPGEGRLLTQDDQVIAAIYGTETADLTDRSPAAPAFASLLIALAPTVRFDGGGTVPAGRWIVEVESDGTQDALLTAQVQRDDTPFGFRPRGRQSYLDADGWVWDSELGALAAPGPGNPISRYGTAVAYAGADNAFVWFVGAARPQIGAPDAAVPARYSAEGIQGLSRPDQSRGPTLAARGDDGVMVTGVRAAGVVSLSYARYSGTSVAAPRVTRALARLWAKSGAPGHPEADLADILAETPPLPTPDTRTGRGVMLRYPHSLRA